MEDLDPALIAQAMGLFSAQQKNPMLANQIAQAQALQQPREMQVMPNSPWGTALAGAANAVDGVTGAVREKDLRGQQRRNIADQQAILDQLAQNQLAQSIALRGSMRPKQEAPQPLGLGDYALTGESVG